jgi:predicted PurR-regulated permease PerM
MSQPVSEVGVPDTLRTLAGITWRVLVVLAGVALAAIVVNRIMPVAFAIFFAMLMTAWAQPLMHVFNRIMPKVLAMVLALLVIGAAVVGILFVVVRATIQEGPKLVESLTSGFADIETWLKTGPLALSDASIHNLLLQAQDWGKTMAGGLLGDAMGALGSIGTLVIAASVFLYGVVFFMLTPATIWDWLVSWMPKTTRKPIDVSGHLAWDAISGYTRGIVIVAFCDALLVFIGLTIMQVPLAPALSAVVFLGAFIPVIGAPIATFFAAVVALAERGPLIALLVIALTVVVGSFDGDVLQPLVMGKAVNLHPLAIVFAIAAGGIAMGIIGALIAVPVAGAIYSVAKYLTGRDAERPYPPPPASDSPPAEPAAIATA